MATTDQFESSESRRSSTTLSSATVSSAPTSFFIPITTRRSAMKKIIEFLSREAQAEYNITTAFIPKALDRSAMPFFAPTFERGLELRGHFSSLEQIYRAIQEIEGGNVTLKGSVSVPGKDGTRRFVLAAMGSVPGLTNWRYQSDDVWRHPLPTHSQWAATQVWFKPPWYPSAPDQDWEILQ